MNAELAARAEEHIRAALGRAEADFPAFPVDSWSDPAVAGQWVVIEDDEGRRSQVRMEDQITRGVVLRPGSLAVAAEKLVGAVLDELRTYVAGDGCVVSRPLPLPEAAGDLCWHLEFRGVWFRLLAGYDPGKDGTIAVLSCLLGRGATPLAEAQEKVVWL